MLEVASIGSGSKGNATLVRWPGGMLLIDCGFSTKETLSRLARLSVTPDQLNAVLVTHEHSDHSGGVAQLARKLNVPVYATHGTFKGMRDLKGFEQVKICSHQSFQMGDLRIQPYPVPHDANEPVQFSFEYSGKRLVVLTDIGSLTPFVFEQVNACHAMVLECNHDLEMLMNGPYPYSLKQRVASDLGHLNNQQSAQLLANMDQRNLRQLVLAHVSEKNNHQDKVLAAVTPHVDASRCQFQMACQKQGFDWVAVN